MALVEATLSVAAAYGSYVLGEQFRVPGVLAVVAAGSMFGNFGRRFGLSERTEEEVDLLWRFLAFVSNSLVFLLLGLAVVPADLVRLGPLLGLGIGATLLGRAVVAYGLGTVLARSGSNARASVANLLVHRRSLRSLPDDRRYIARARNASDPSLMLPCATLRDPGRAQADATPRH